MKLTEAIIKYREQLTKLEEQHSVICSKLADNPEKDIEKKMLESLRTINEKKLILAKKIESLQSNKQPSKIHLKLRERNHAKVGCFRRGIWGNK